ITAAVADGSTAIAILWASYSARAAYGSAAAGKRAAASCAHNAGRKQRAQRSRESLARSGPKDLPNPPGTARRSSMKAKLHALECDEEDLIELPDSWIPGAPRTQRVRHPEAQGVYVVLPRARMMC